MAQSRAALAYLPEQVVWYLLAMLAVAGALFGFRRDAIVTGLLVGHALVIAAAVAFTGGNVGTLVRHRGLALPYLVWLSGVGACELLVSFRRPDVPFRRLARRSSADRDRSGGGKPDTTDEGGGVPSVRPLPGLRSM